MYGYRNVRGADHVTRVIEPTEAAIVRRIFEACANGQGIVRIAKTLNAAGVSGPRGRSWGWSPGPSPSAQRKRFDSMPPA